MYFTLDGRGGSGTDVGRGRRMKNMLLLQLVLLPQQIPSVKSAILPTFYSKVAGIIDRCHCSKILTLMTNMVTKCDVVIVAAQGSRIEHTLHSTIAKNTLHRRPLLYPP